MFDVICSLDVSYFSNFILLGDFNVDILSPSSLCNHLNSILHSFSLVQVVTDHEPTHIKHDGSSFLLDLVITSTPEAVFTCSTLPPLANSDHYGVLINVQCKLVRIKRRLVWRHEHADFTLACALLRYFDFGHFFDGRSCVGLNGRVHFWKL